MSKGAVSQWMKRAREEGVQALKRQPAPGALPRLSEEQRAKVPELLEWGAEAHGFRGEAWTCERVATSDPKGVWGQLPSGSCESFAQSVEAEPAEAAAPGESEGRGGHRALERREVAFPQKRALKEGRTIVFADQSGFYLCCLWWFALTLR